MKIRFIEPRPPDFTVYDQALLPRLGLPLLGRILADEGHDVRIYVETLAPIDWHDVAGADLVGFSATTATAPAAYRMAEQCRTIATTRTVIGGSHVTFLPDEGLEHCDYVVRGEGQVAILELLSALAQERSLDSVAGLSYHGSDGKKRHNADRPFCSQEALAALPAPDLSLIAGHERMTNVPIMTQWGCPYDCDFCSVIKMFGRRVRARNVEDVLVELDRYRDRDSVFFYDDNFVVNKQRTGKLLGAMIERGFGLRWSAQMRADTVYKDKRTREVDHAFLDLMRRSGAQMVYCGFESVNPATLQAYNKHQDVETIRDAVRVFHDYGIAVHGMFVVGSDADDVRTLDQTATFALQNKIDTIQLMMLTPCPGTAFFDRMSRESRLLSRDWSLFDGHHCLIRPAKMTPYELQVGTYKAMARFYMARHSVPLLIGKVIRNLPFFSGLVLRYPSLVPRILLRRKSENLVSVINRLLSRNVRHRLADILLVPALRLYARRHIGKWVRRPGLQRYLKWLLSTSTAGDLVMH
jgi:anaerobic magnesium-protoporphyrin IX monomethyl ester cyclase